MKIKKTYHDNWTEGRSIDGTIHDASELRKYYEDRGESKAWIDFVFEELEKGNTISTRFAKLEPIKE